jgi:hypothetical protein
MGSQRSDIDFEAAWRLELARGEGRRKERKEAEAGANSCISTAPIKIKVPARLTHRSI